LTEFPTAVVEAAEPKVEAQGSVAVDPPVLLASIKKASISCELNKDVAELKSKALLLLLLFEVALNDENNEEFADVAADADEVEADKVCGAGVLDCSRLTEASEGTGEALLPPEGGGVPNNCAKSNAFEKGEGDLATFEAAAEAEEGDVVLKAVSNGDGSGNSFSPEVSCS
jgi:hypothetical protein